MYVPPLFRIEERDAIHATMRAAPLAQLVTHTDDGLIASHLPLYLAADEGEHGTLYGHLARANPQWRLAPNGEALAIFMGPDAYVSPSFYPSKQETHKVVPTWNYIAIHAYGPVEFFDEPDRVHKIVSVLTDLLETPRPQPWSVDDAPAPFIAAQLRAIAGLRIPITRIEAKCKMSQNRSEKDREGVIAGLGASTNERERAVAKLIPRG